MSEPAPSAKITKAIEKMPQWLRRDLNASDPKARERAHEALAAIIVDALGDEPSREQG